MVRVREETTVRYPQAVEEGDVEVLANALYIKPDGRTVRFVSPSAPSVPAHSAFVNGVASKDIEIEAKNGLWGRIFLPESVAKKGPDVKVPVLVFYHGGGFAVGSPDFTIFDVYADHCEAAARISEVVVITMSYRLAPEHRLPAAYEDAFTSVLWLQKQAALQAKGEGGEPWLLEHADFSECFVMGESAGGNIVHHIGLQFAKTNLSPLSIRGLIFLVPWFAKEERTESELVNGATDVVAPLALLDRFWEIALPLGANRDHPYSNVFGPDHESNATELPLPKALIIVGTKDPVYNRQIEYVNALEKAGRNVELLEVPGGGHGFRMFPQFASEVYRFEQAIRAFIHEGGGSS